MTIALNTASGGMNAFQQMLDVIGNNISNVNTTAFKAGAVNFSDVLSQTTSQGSSGNGTSSAPGVVGGTNPLQVGLGVQVAQIYQDFSQGSMTPTGNPNNLMISGNGFFMVSTTPNPTSATQVLFTRAGDFSVDSNGNLVTPNGYYLLGVSGTAAAVTPSTSTFPTTLVPINVNQPNAASTTGTASSFSVGPDGKVTVTNGTVTYYIPLAIFENPNGLLKAGNSLYTSNGAPNTGATTYGSASSTNFGSINQGALEGSNVNLTGEMSNMIVAQTGYEANSKVISTVNQMNQFMLQNV